MLKKLGNKGVLINLQLFGEVNTGFNDPALQEQVMNIINGTVPQEQPQQGGETPTEGTPPPQEVPQEQNGQMEQPSQAPQGQIDPATSKILGKFNSPEDLAKAYQNLEGFNTQTRQELAQYKTNADQLKAELENLKTQISQNTTPPANASNNTVPGENEEGEEVDTQAFMDKFYENPIEAIKSILSQNANPQVQGIMEQVKPVIDSYNNQQKQQEWMNRVNDFASQHEDLPQFNQSMADLLNQYPEMKEHPQGLDILYSMAKGANYKDPNSLLQDENFVNSNILGNEDIKNKIIADYLKNVKANGSPVTISGQSGQLGGQIPLTPENKPANMEEARLMAMKMFGK